MAQLVYPTSDVTNQWASGGFGDIDEGGTPDDGDFANSSDAGDETLEVHIGDPTDPASSSGHIVHWRHVLIDGGVLAGSAGSGADITVSLVQGTTVIAGSGLLALDAVLAWTDASFTLSGAEADSITDYPDLRIRFFAEGGGGSPTNRRGVGVSWAEFEVPDAASSTPQALVATATATSTLTPLSKKVFAVGATATPALVKVLSLKRILTAGATGTPSLSKKMSVVFAVTATSMAILAGATRFKKALSASVTGTATLSNKFTFREILAVSAMATASFGKKIFKILAATITATAAIVRDVTFSGGSPSQKHAHGFHRNRRLRGGIAAYAWRRGRRH